MEIAKNTDLPDLLEHLGYHLKRSGRYYTTQEMDSLMIKNRRTWRQYSNDTGGDGITFLQTFEGKGFREAVEYLLDFNGRAIVVAKSASWEMPYGHSPLRSLVSPLPTKPEGRLCGGPIDSPRDSRPRPPPEEEKRPEFVLPPANEDNCRVFAYLRKRGIAPQVIRAFLNAGLVYEDEKYHNCVFVGWDNSGEARFASKRGTYDKDGVSFKRDVLGSDKSIAFPIPCDPAVPWVLVFEAPIDLMSFCTLHREVRSNAVALCGLYNGALDTYLRDHPHLNHVVFCLDADGPGQAATEKLRTEYEGRGLKVSIRTPAKGKDWNEYLQQRGPPRERGR